MAACPAELTCRATSGFRSSFALSLPRLSAQTMGIQSLNDFPFIKIQVWLAGRLKSASASTSGVLVMGGGMRRLGRVLFLVVIRGRCCPSGFAFISTASERSIPADFAGRTRRLRESAWRDSKRLYW